MVKENSKERTKKIVDEIAEGTFNADECYEILNALLEKSPVIGGTIYTVDDARMFIGNAIGDLSGDYDRNENVNEGVEEFCDAFYDYFENDILDEVDNALYDFAIRIVKGQSN